MTDDGRDASEDQARIDGGLAFSERKVHEWSDSSFFKRLVELVPTPFCEPTFITGEGDGESRGVVTLDQLLFELSQTRPENWVIQGAPGAGKTTLLRALAAKLLTLDIVPIVFDHQMEMREGQGLREVADAARPDDVPLKLWRSRVKQGRCVFLIDALNEMQRKPSSARLTDLVSSAMRGGHKYTIVVTSRISSDYPTTIRRTQTLLDMAPLAEGEIAKYLRAVAPNYAEVRDAKRGILLNNPLMLTLFAELMNEPGAGVTPPRSRSQLFSMLISRIRRSGNLSQEESVADRGPITLEMVLIAGSALAISDPDQQFSTVELKELLSAVNGANEGLESVVAAFVDTYMVAPEPDLTGRYAFSHSSFVDYGLALAHRNVPLPPAFWNSKDFPFCLGNWIGLATDPNQTAISFLDELGTTGTAMNWCPTLIDVAFANRSVLSTAVRARLCAGIARAFTQQGMLRIDEQSKVVEALNQLPRWAMGEALRLAHVLDAGSGLRPLLLRQVAFGELELRVIRRTIRTARNNRIAKNRKRRNRALASAAMLLGANPDINSYLEELKTTVKTAADDMVAILVDEIDILSGEMRQRYHLDRLLNGERPIVRETAASFLGALRSRPIEKALIHALIEDESTDVRAACAEALGKVGSSPSVLPLVTQLASQSSNVRLKSAAALGRIGDTKAVEPLLRRLGEETSYEVKAAIVTSLGTIGDPRAVADVIVATTEASTQVRIFACKALGDLGDPSAIAALSRRAADDIGAVRGSAITSLGLMRDSRAMPSILDASEHADGKTRALAAKELGRFDTDSSKAVLTRLLSDPDPFVRSASVQGLATSMDRQTLNVIREVLTDADEDQIVRAAAMSVIRRSGNLTDLPALATVARSSIYTPWTRGVAVLAYSSISSDTPSWMQELADELSTITGTPDEESISRLRGTLIFAIASKCNPECVPWLENIAMNDFEVENRTAAMQNLIGHGVASKEFIDRVLKKARLAIAQDRKPDLATIYLVVSEVARQAATGGGPILIDSIRDVCLELQLSTRLARALIDLDTPYVDPVLSRIESWFAGVVPIVVQETIDLVRRSQAAQRELIDAEDYLRSHPRAVLTAYLGTALPASADSASKDVEGVDMSVVLFVTVNAIETTQLKSALQLIYGPEQIVHMSVNSYAKFEKAGLPLCFHLRSGMGSSGTRGSNSQVGDAIRDLSPHSVVGVGVAWAASEEKYPIGSVLVSTQVWDFEKRRIGTRSDGVQEVIERGIRTDASARLVNRFLAASYTLEPPSIVDGPILSGEKLIDNMLFKKELLSAFPEAIGGEMEGAGIQAACDRSRVEWILVKGVCDYAEKKSKNKVQRQNTAASAATRAVIAVLNQGGFDL